MSSIELSEASNHKDGALTATELFSGTNSQGSTVSNTLVASHESTNDDDTTDFSTLIDSESEHDGLDNLKQSLLAYQQQKRKEKMDLDMGVMKDEYSKAAVHTVLATKLGNHPDKRGGAADFEVGVMKDQYSSAAINSSRATFAINIYSDSGTVQSQVHDSQLPTPPHPSIITVSNGYDDNVTLFSAELVNLESDRRQLVEEVLQAIHHQAVSATEVVIATEDDDESNSRSSNSSNGNKKHKTSDVKMRFRLCALVGFLLFLVGILAIIVGVVLNQLMNHPILSSVAITSIAKSQAPTLSPLQDSRNPITIGNETIRINSTKDVFQNEKELYLAVYAYAENSRTSINPEQSEVAMRYGYPIGTWNVSLIRDFSRMFDPLRRKEFFEVTDPVQNTASGKVVQPVFTALALFNEDLGGWDVSNATTMFGMFVRAESFEGRGLERWNVGKVQDFSYMFFGATSFDGNISGWDSSGCSYIHSMFSSATTFNGDLSKWDTTRVKNMDYTFANALKFEGKSGLNAWAVSNVKSMISAFEGAENFDGDISQWNTSKVVDMSNMFKLASVFNGDLTAWSVGSVQKITSMFHSAYSFEGDDLSKWDTSSVTDMSATFYGATNFTGNIDNWNVSNVKTFGSTFHGASNFNGNLSLWDTSNAEQMNSMFTDAYDFEGHGLSNWNTGNVVSMNSQFFSAFLFNGNISNWDTSTVNDMNKMFTDAISFNIDISRWNVSSVLQMNEMFSNAKDFNQNLCYWYTLLNEMTFANDMFDDSGCPIQDEPILGRSIHYSQYETHTNTTNVYSFCKLC